MEANPVTKKIWKEWCEEDKKLSLLTEEERMNLVSQYQWLFPKEENDFVDLECLYTRKHIKSSREKFHRFFFVVCNRMFSRPFFANNCLATSTIFCLVFDIDIRGYLLNY